MKYFYKCFLAIMLFIAVEQAASACNVCGGAATGGGSSLLEQSSNTYLGFSYSHQNFMQQLHDRKVNDYFHQLTIWSKIKVTDKLYLKINVPYAVNIRKGLDNDFSLKGLGDLRVSGEYVILNTFDNSDGNLKNRISTGVGIKAPTGSNNTILEGIIIPTNMNIGTGSWDILLNTNYAIAAGEAGVNMDINYRLTTRNSSLIKMGNQLTSDVFGSYKINAEDVKLLPFAGIYAELLGENKINDFPEHGTGGFGLFSKTGVEVHFKSFGLSCQYKIPLINSYADNAAVANPRLDFNIFYKF